MSLMLLEHLRTARESLRRTRTRTLLTISGVAIGVASITAIMALGSGISAIITRQVSDLGANIAVVRPASRPLTLTDFSNPAPQNNYATSPLQERDVAALAGIDGVETAVPIMMIKAPLSSSEGTPSDWSIMATTPDFPKTTQLTMLDGQFIDHTTLENTAVLGEQLALNLFGTDQAVGKSFRIRGQSFTVIGIIKRQAKPMNFNNIDLDQSAIISLDSGKLFNSGAAQISQINIRAKKGVAIAELKSQFETTLAAAHDNQHDVDVLVGHEIAAPSNQMFELINRVMALIAGISLLVGGIGIMNIMLVSVAERTREIGLRKAVGATSASIITQFMIEALIISLLGGIVGYLGGYLLAFFISLLLPYDPVFTWQIAVIALGLAVVVGTIFGAYPAIKAARKSPIESLRRMH